MAKPKKNLKQEIAEELEEAAEEVVVLNIQSANSSRKAQLEIRLAYLQELRDKFSSEGVNSIGSLDVVISKVIQELGTL